MLNAAERIRLVNYRTLHRRASLRFHPQVTELELRYAAVLGTRQEEAVRIDDDLAEAVEEVYGLPPGWLSVDHADPEPSPMHDGSDSLALAFPPSRPQAPFER